MAKTSSRAEIFDDANVIVLLGLQVIAESLDCGVEIRLPAAGQASDQCDPHPQSGGEKKRDRQREERNRDFLLDGRLGGEAFTRPRPYWERPTNSCQPPPARQRGLLAQGFVGIRREGVSSRVWAPQSRAQALQHVVRDFEISVDILHVVEILKPLDHAQQLLRALLLDRHAAFRPPQNARRAGSPNLASRALPT